MVLDQALTTMPIMPIRLYVGTQPGEQVRDVGYGVVADDAGASVRYSLSGLTITEVGTSQFRPVGDAIPPRTFETDGPAMCYGDSGGPALSDQNAVIGIFSQFVGDCMVTTVRDFYTEVAPFAADVILTRLYRCRLRAVARRQFRTRTLRNWRGWQHGWRFIHGWRHFSSKHERRLHEF